MCIKNPVQPATIIYVYTQESYLPCTVCYYYLHINTIWLSPLHCLLLLSTHKYKVVISPVLSDIIIYT